MNTVIDLNAFDLQPIGAALILLGPTGVSYNHQAGGTCCHQKQAEGSYVPVPGLDLSELAEARPLQDLGNLTAGDVAKAVKLLTAAGVPFAVSVDLESLRQSCEAWLVGRVKTGDKPWKTLPAGLDAPAVLLRDNTD